MFFHELNFFPQEHSLEIIMKAVAQLLNVSYADAK